MKLIHTGLAGAFAVLAALSLAACNGAPGATSSSAAATAEPSAQTFEATRVPGGSNVVDNFMKVNVQTGQTWVHCCFSNNTTFTATTEPGPLPAGDYHLYAWTTPNTQGSHDWEVYRMDRRTGHAWVLTCQTSPTCSWTALTP